MNEILEGKICRACGNRKTLREFAHRKKERSYRNECKKCIADYQRVVSKDKVRFGGNREVAIQRDGEACIKCGMSRATHKSRFKRDITVNHKDGHGRYSATPNNDLDNLETLCIPCHVTSDASLRKNLNTQSLGAL